MTFLLCDPGWYVHKPDVQNKWEENTHTYPDVWDSMMPMFVPILVCTSLLSLSISVCTSICAYLCVFARILFLFFSFISLIADGPHHYHPACGHKGSSHLSPVHALHFFYRDASSALLQLVNQWLNFTYSRSHAFRYERKNTNPTLVRIELTTSVLADVQLTY